MTSLSIGRSFFGLATMASGVLQLVTGDFVRLVPKLPAWVPAPSTWAYVVGVVLVVAGLAILSGRMVRTAAAVVGAMTLLTAGVFEALALSGVALIVAGTRAPRSVYDPSRAVRRDVHPLVG